MFNRTLEQQIAEERQLLSQRFKPKKLNSFDDIRAEGEKRKSPVLQKEEEASLRHDIARVKYSISLEETRLLNKVMGNVIGNRFTRILHKFKNEQDDTSIEYAINSIEEKIQEIQSDNAALKPFAAIFFKKSVDHLVAAKTYLQFHQEKYDLVKSPEKSLSQDPANPIIEKTGTTFRNNFSKTVGKLSGLFGRNRALKKLNNILHKKQAVALDLKYQYTTAATPKTMKYPSPEYKKELVRAGKQGRHEYTKNNLTTTGVFFTPHNLIAFGGRLIAGKDGITDITKNSLNNLIILKPIDSEISRLNKIFANAPIANPDAEPIEDIERIKTQLNTIQSQDDSLEKLQNLLDLQAQTRTFKANNVTSVCDELTLDNVFSLNHEQIAVAINKVNMMNNAPETKLLAHIGNSIQDLKNSKKNLIQKANSYNNCSTALLQVKQQMLHLLTAADDAENWQEVLQAEIVKQKQILNAETSGLVIDGDAITNFSADFIIYLKAKSVIADCKYTLDNVHTKEGLQEAITALNNAMQGLTTKNQSVQENTQKLINEADNVLKGILYSAKHETAHLKELSASAYRSN